jgi:predicted MPP superfamily phosphohydrolase
MCQALPGKERVNLPWSNRKKAAVAAGGAGIAALLYSIAVEPYHIEHVEIELQLPRLPEEFDGYRVLQISDLHMRKMGRREKLLQSILRKLPSHDLALITGDLIHTPGGAAHFITLSRSIVATDGVYAVFGNSEHKNGVRSKEFAKQLGKAGITALINSSTIINRGGSRIYLLGVDDPVSQKEDLRAAISGVPDEAFKLLMMHSPDPIGQASAYGIDLVLSGHTHGGQVRIPGIGALHTNTVLGLSMDSGLFKEQRLFDIIGFRAGRTQLYVSRGVGSSGFALRFMCPPEITSITLKRI